MSDTLLLKNWFDKRALGKLATRLAETSPDFDRAGFTKQAGRGLAKLEMIARVKQWSDAMRAFLPKDVPQALDILVNGLPSANESEREEGGHVLLWPYGQFIADHGLAHYEASMAAMYELTQRFSSEFAVRPFVEQHPKRTFAQLSTWTKDPNKHVRRWCSEGVRPRLPWGKKLHALVADPSPIFPILEALRDDPELYVRRSVANNINDIAKDNPQLVLSLCKRWMKGASEERAWIVKHGLRSLIKAGDPKALKIMGFPDAKNLTAQLRVTPAAITEGQRVVLKLKLRNEGKRAKPVAIDFKVHYRKANGQARPKVFKWTTTTLAAKEEITLEKSLHVRHVSTRTLFCGRHRVEVQLNGQVLAHSRFDLSL